MYIKEINAYGFSANIYRTEMLHPSFWSSWRNKAIDAMSARLRCTVQRNDSVNRECLELWKQSEKKSGSQVEHIAILQKKGPENILGRGLF